MQNLNLSRAQDLEAWSLVQLGLDGQADYHFSSVSGDASFRRYFRLTLESASEGNSWICVDAPAPQESVDTFVETAALFRQTGVRVPQIIAADPDLGFMLQEDLGAKLLLPELSYAKVDEWYQRAIKQLLQFQSLAHAADLPAYDDARLLQELSLFPEWCIEGFIERPLSADDRDMLSYMDELLLANAKAQPRVLVHRDYHARNLMITPEGELAVIDFQDAVWGPLTYDLVSLLKDCYVRWPRNRVESWVQQTLIDMKLTNPQLLDVTPDTFLRWFDWMGLQRHLKVLGIFCRLSLRDGKHDYLKDIPRVAQYVMDVVSRYPEFRDWWDWYRQEIHTPLMDRLAIAGVRLEESES